MLCDSGQRLVHVDQHIADIEIVDTTCSDMEFAAMRGNFSPASCDYLRQSMSIVCQCRSSQATCQPCREAGYEVLGKQANPTVCHALKTAALQMGAGTQECEDIQTMVENMNCQCDKPSENFALDSVPSFPAPIAPPPVSPMAPLLGCQVCPVPGHVIIAGDSDSMCGSIKEAAESVDVDAEVCNHLQTASSTMNCPCRPPPLQSTNASLGQGQPARPLSSSEQVCQACQTPGQEIVADDSDSMCGSLKIAASHEGVPADVCQQLQSRVVLAKCECDFPRIDVHAGMHQGVFIEPPLTEPSCQACPVPGHEILVDDTSTLCGSLKLSAAHEGVPEDVCHELQSTVIKMNCPCGPPDIVFAAPSDVSEPSSTSKLGCGVCPVPGHEIHAEDSNSLCGSLKISASHEGVPEEACLMLKEQAVIANCQCGPPAMDLHFDLRDGQDPDVVTTESGCQACPVPGHEIIAEDDHSICGSLRISASFEGIDEDACDMLRESVKEMKCQCAPKSVFAPTKPTGGVDSPSKPGCQACRVAGHEIIADDSNSLCGSLKISASHEEIPDDACTLLQQSVIDMNCICGMPSQDVVVQVSDNVPLKPGGCQACPIPGHEIIENDSNTLCGSLKISATHEGIHDDVCRMLQETVIDMNCQCGPRDYQAFVQQNDDIKSNTKPGCQACPVSGHEIISDDSDSLCGSLKISASHEGIPEEACAYASEYSSPDELSVWTSGRILRHGINQSQAFLTWHPPNHLPQKCSSPPTMSRIRFATYVVMVGQSGTFVELRSARSRTQRAHRCSLAATLANSLQASVNKFKRRLGRATARRAVFPFCKLVA